MNSLERTLGFLRQEPVDRTPFHPIVMRFAARHAGVPYRAFCLDPEAHVGAMARTAADFDMDRVNVMSDPYAEVEAYGMRVEYPEDGLPHEVATLAACAAQVERIRAPENLSHPRLAGRLLQIEAFARRFRDRQFVVGWVEGPFAVYSLWRGLSEACLDLYDDPAAVRRGVEIAVGFAKRFAEAQVRAGAHAIGMGDAACSQIGPDQYREFFVEGEREVVDHVHSLGALAKLHICGNTSKLLPEMIGTGADIVDVDHLAGSMAPFAPMLGPTQAFCGSADPVRVVRDGNPEAVIAAVLRCRDEAGGRAIVSAGCEIPPDTDPENVLAMARAARL
jgi:MtaA/CmuA family methyltransferase